MMANGFDSTGREFLWGYCTFGVNWPGPDRLVLQRVSFSVIDLQ